MKVKFVSVGAVISAVHIIATGIALGVAGSRAMSDIDAASCKNTSAVKSTLEWMLVVISLIALGTSGATTYLFAQVHKNIKDLSAVTATAGHLSRDASENSENDPSSPEPPLEEQKPSVFEEVSELQAHILSAVETIRTLSLYVPRGAKKRAKSISIKDAKRTSLIARTQSSTPSIVVEKPGDTEGGAFKRSDNYAVSVKTSPPGAAEAPCSPSGEVLTTLPNIAVMRKPSKLPTYSFETKQGTVLAIVLEGSFVDNGHDENVMFLNTTMCNLLTVCRQHEGAIQSFSLTSLTVVWNVHNAIVCATTVASACAIDCEKVLRGLPGDTGKGTVRWGIAVTSGPVMVGDAGDMQQQAEIIHGSTVFLAHDLARLNFTLSTRILISEHVFDSAQGDIIALLVDFVPVTELNTLAVYELRGMKHETPSVVAPSSQDVRIYNEAFAALRTNKFLEAHEKFSNFVVTNGTDEQGNRLKKLCALLMDERTRMHAGIPPCYHRKKQYWQSYETTYFIAQPPPTPPLMPIPPSDATLLIPKHLRHSSLNRNPSLVERVLSFLLYHPP